MDNGSFPTDISQLTIEYSGDEVVCTTTQLKSDSSVYLAGCTVGGRSVDYAYGTEETVTYDTYSVGDELSYNNVDYSVIVSSGANESTVTLMKATPLTVAEINQYGAGHINRYTSDTNETAYDVKSDGTVGGIAYYSSSTCGHNGTDSVDSGCTTNYAQLEVKYVVDTWKTEKAPAATEARLLTTDEISSLEYECGQTYPTCDNGWIKTENVPIWLYNSDYWYWTMSQYQDSTYRVWCVGSYGLLGGGDGAGVYSESGVVRPVIVLPKSALSA